MDQPGGWSSELAYGIFHLDLTLIFRWFSTGFRLILVCFQRRLRWSPRSRVRFKYIKWRFFNIGNDDSSIEKWWFCSPAAGGGAGWVRTVRVSHRVLRIAIEMPSFLDFFDWKCRKNGELPLQSDDFMLNNVIVFVIRGTAMAFERFSWAWGATVCRGAWTTARYYCYLSAS